MKTLSAAAPWTAAMRCRISSRALLVNVRQRIDAGVDALADQPAGALGERRVLPDPGPASVRIRPCDVVGDLFLLRVELHRRRGGRYKSKRN